MTDALTWVFLGLGVAALVVMLLATIGASLIIALVLIGVVAAMAVIAIAA